MPNWCLAHFGIPPEVFAGHRFWQKQGQSEIWIAPRDNTPASVGCLVSFGLMVMRRPPPRGKPTSIFLQRFGRDASRNVIELTVGELQRYLARSPLAVARPNLTYGDCIVRYKGRVLGCGRYEDGLLVNYWPKHFTAPLPNQMPLF